MAIRHSNIGKERGSYCEGNDPRLGTKDINETSIGNGKILQYNATSNQLEYSTPALSDAVQETITQASHGFNVLDAVSHNGTSWVKALAESVAGYDCQAVVIAVDGDDFTICTHGVATVNSHGLTIGEYYYLSQSTVGSITTTKPTENLLQQVLFVRNADTLFIDIEGVFDLSASSGGGSGSLDINSLDEKTAVVNTDAFVIADSENSYANKKVLVSNLGIGSGAGGTKVGEEVTGAYRVITSADEGKILYVKNACQIATDETLSVDAEVDICSYTTGSVDIIQGSNTINSKSSYKKIEGQFAKATLKKKADREYLLTGDLTTSTAEPITTILSGEGFTETAANDGSVQGFIEYTLGEGEFITTPVVGTDIEIENIPSGLTPLVTTYAPADLTTWLSATGGTYFVKVIKTSNRLIALTYAGYVWESLDEGETFTNTSVYIGASSIGGNYQAIDTDGDQTIVCTSSSDNHWYFSTDEGYTWTRSATTVSANFLVYIPTANRFIAGSSTTYIFSEDLATYTTKTHAIGYSMQKATYHANTNRLYMAYATQGQYLDCSDVINNSYVMFTTTLPSNVYSGIFEDNGKLIAFSSGAGGYFYISTNNGSSWTSNYFGSSFNVSEGLKIGSTYLIACSDKTLRLSVDGCVTFSVVLSVSNNLRGISFAESLGKAFIAEYASSNGVHYSLGGTILTNLKIELTGNATSHTTADNVDNIVVKMKDSILTTEPSIEYYDYDVNTNKGVSFDD